MTVSLNELDSHLFKCADIIRDAVDSTDYKEYILPLVYYKSISDEFEKQYEENVEEYGEEFARRENLYDVPVIPDGYMWDDVRAVSDNVDEALNESFEALIEANPELGGVFRTDYIDANALKDDRLGRLVEHLSKYDLDRDSVPPDMLGEAYMDLVRNFAEEEGKSGGQFFTPPRIVNLCVRLVDPFDDDHALHDPTVGMGEIRENDYNLNIALYVDTTEPEEDIDVEEELAKLRDLQAERDEIEAQMTQHMEALNYE